MGVEDGLKAPVHITSYDVTNAAQLKIAMAKIIARNTKIILGPLYSNMTSAIADQANENDIIVITMSNNPVLADSKLFVFGHAPLKQLDKLISYYLDNNYKNFISLLPQGQHSQTVNQVIQQMLLEQNATLVRTEFYSQTPESIEKSIATISSSVDNLNEVVENITKPVVYISGDTDKNLNLIFNAIRKHHLDKKAVIVGDNRIDIDYPDDIEINFTGSLNNSSSDVTERTKYIGIRHLSFMHLMAYDIGRMTANYIGSNFVREQFLARINSRTPYIGISGDIYFVDSIAQRTYSIIRRDGDVYITLRD